jgi:hypothetical protein
MKSVSVSSVVRVILAGAACALALAAAYAIKKLGVKAGIGVLIGLVVGFCLWYVLSHIDYAAPVSGSAGSTGGGHASAEPSTAAVVPPGKPPPDDTSDAIVDPPDATGKLEQLKVIGGLVALGSGLAALVIVVIVAFIAKPDTTAGSIATSAIGVIGSIVGAYFGVKIGSDGTAKAVEGQKEEATKAQVFALHTPPERAEAAMQDLHGLLRDQRGSSGRR